MMLKKLTFVLAFLAFASPSFSQVAMSRNGGGSGGSGTVTIENGVTATSGCIAGGVLRSISNLVDCSTGIVWSGGTLTLNNGVSAVSPLVVQDNGTPVLTVTDNGQKLSAAYNGTWELYNSFGGSTLGFANTGHIYSTSPTYGGFINQASTNSHQSYEVGVGKALTESTATNVVLVSLGSGAAAGGHMEYTVSANDGTDFQTRSGRFNYSIANKAGTETCGLSAADEIADGSSVAASAGTLTYTIDCDTSPTNGVYIRFNAVSSLTQTTLKINGFKISGWAGSNGGPVFTFTPQ